MSTPTHTVVEITRAVFGVAAIGLATQSASAGEFAVVQEAQKLLASDGAAGDNFGTSIEREGDTLVIGAPQHFSNSLPGSFYVFTRDAAGAWNEQARIFSDFQPGQAEFGDHFGEALALQGDTLLVGAPFAELNGTTLAGKVYVYMRNAAGVWNHQQTLLPNDPDTPPGGRFGTRVALFGDVAVITGFRRAFVFTRNASGIWSQQTSMRPFENTIRNLAFDGERIALTEYPAEDLRTAIFTGSASGWGEPVYLSYLIGGEEQASMGASFCGEQFALGAADFNGFGRVILFCPSKDGDWNQQIELASPAQISFAGFGAAIDGDDETMVIGAPHANQAFMYQPQPDAGQGQWEIATELHPSDAGTWAHNFGRAVHVRDNIAVVGSSAHHQNGLYSGAVYVFDTITPPTPGDISGDGLVNVQDLLGVINAWGECPAPPQSCPADIAPQPAGDGQVNVLDLLMVINNWG